MQTQTSQSKQSSQDETEIEVDEESTTDRVGNQPSEQQPLENACNDNWTWSFKNKSHEVVLHGPKHRIAKFHPHWSNGTAGVRGTRQLNNKKFWW